MCDRLVRQGVLCVRRLCQAVDGWLREYVLCYYAWCTPVVPDMSSAPQKADDGRVPTCQALTDEQHSLSVCVSQAGQHALPACSGVGVCTSHFTTLATCALMEWVQDRVISLSALLLNCLRGC